MKAEKPYQFYRLDIHSSDTLNGSIYNGEFFIDLPLLPNVDYQLAVESFVSNTYVDVIIEIPQMHQRNSYYTDSKSTSNKIFQTTQDTYNTIITKDTIGHYVPNNDFFRSKKINIKLVNLADLTVMNAGLTSWSLSLVIYPIYN